MRRRRRQANENMKAQAPQHGGADQTSSWQQYRSFHDQSNGRELALGAEPEGGGGGSKVVVFVRKGAMTRKCVQERGRWQVAQ